MYKTLRSRRLAKAVALTLPTALSGAVYHQTAYAADAGATALEEIVVTARKREESLQETPIAITAFSAAGLEARNIQQVSEIAAFAPNITFDGTANIGASNSIAAIYIRGIGQDDFTGVIDPGVGLYVDGVYFARSVGAVLDVVDFERVEVLRGPQGTLFGRNTIGGAVNITSRKPGDELLGNIRVEIGDDSKQYVSGSLDIPISDTVSTNISLASKQRDGYVKALQPGIDDFGDEDRLIGRVALRYTPSDSFELNFTADATRQREQAAPNTLVAVNPNEGFAAGAFNASVGGDCHPVANPDNPACYSSYYVRSPDATLGTYHTDTDSINNVVGPMSPKTELDVWGTALSMEWSVNDWLTIRSITAYRESDSFYSRDADQSPHPIVQSVTDWEHEQFSQEFQLLGESLDGQFNWIVGAYYFEEEGDFIDAVEFFELPIQSGGKFDNDSIAAFAQGSYNFNEQFTITAGLRYTDDSREYSPDQFILGPNQFGIPVGVPIVPHETAKISEDDVPPYLNRSYQLNDDILTYISYSEGFKSGGFTQRVFPPIDYIPSFEPEFVDVYEVGIKSEWLDRRLQVNAALFYSEYTDIQVLVAQGPAPTTQNAAEATIQGGELEILALPVENMSLEFSLGYIDAEYDKLDDSAIAAGLTPDKEFSNTPELSLNAAISYDIEIDQIGVITPRIDWRYRDDMYNDALNSELLKQDSYDLIDLSISFVDVSGLWSVVLRGTNLSDERFIVSGQDQTQAGVGNAEAVFSRPRGWSLAVERRF